MTTSPQDALTAERAAQLYGSLTCTTYREGYQDPENDIALIAEELKTARQEALREALRDLDSLHWKDHWYADQLRKKINDRLASEGG
jgi:ribosome-binding ATPase YchF (GTP1/OBG family)